MSNRRHHRNKLKSLYIWHRYAGLFAALFVIFITISGIALNHTDDLALKKQHISTDILLDRYNIQAPLRILQFNIAGRTATQADDLLFLGSSAPLTTDAPLIGMVKVDALLAVALSDSILLIDENNQLVEKLGRIDGIPSSITSIGVDNKLQVNILANGQIYRLSSTLLLQKVAWNYDINWSIAENLTTKQVTGITHRYKSNIISLETLLLDIHSGRFFGSYGTLFFDVVGVILLFLSFTGVIIWFRQRPQKNRNV